LSGLRWFCGTVETGGKVKSITRKTDVWATRVRSSILRPGHPPLYQENFPTFRA
jgi:hypothetical protein